MKDILCNNFKVSIFFFGQERKIHRWARGRRGQPPGSHKGRAPHLSRGPPSGCICNMWPLAIQDELLFCHHVFQFICTKLSKRSVLGDVDLLAAKELELGPTEGLDHRLLVLPLSADGHCDLANVDPGQCAPGLFRGTTHTCLELRLGTACQSWKSTGKLYPRSLRATCTGNRLHTLPRRLLFAATAHWAPTGKRAQSA